MSKPLTEFHRQRKGPMGRHSWCKPCFNTRARETRARAYTTEQKQRWNLATRYRLSVAQVQQLHEAQQGLCAICTQPLVKACVDHCHSTGRVRGLLCHRCNVQLPAVEDEAYRQAAMAYLARHEASAPLT
jgi:hypothetical protein